MEDLLFFFMKRFIVILTLLISANVSAKSNVCSDLFFPGIWPVIKATKGAVFFTSPGSVLLANPERPPDETRLGGVLRRDEIVPGPPGYRHLTTRTIRDCIGTACKNVGVAVSRVKHKIKRFYTVYTGKFEITPFRALEEWTLDWPVLKLRKVTKSDPKVLSGFLKFPVKLLAAAIILSPVYMEGDEQFWVELNREKMEYIVEHQKELLEYLDTDFRFDYISTAYHKHEFNDLDAAHAIFIRLKQDESYFKSLEKIRRTPITPEFAEEITEHYAFSHLRFFADGVKPSRGMIVPESAQDDLTLEQVQKLIRINIEYKGKDEILRNYFDHNEQYKKDRSNLVKQIAELKQQNPNSNEAKYAELALKQLDDLTGSSFFKRLEALYNSKQIDWIQFKIAVQKGEFWKKTFREFDVLEEVHGNEIKEDLGMQSLQDPSRVMTIDEMLDIIVEDAPL